MHQSKLILAVPPVFGRSRQPGSAAALMARLELCRMLDLTVALVEVMGGV